MGRGRTGRVGDELGDVLVGEGLDVGELKDLEILAAGEEGREALERDGREAEVDDLEPVLARLGQHDDGGVADLGAPFDVEALERGELGEDGGEVLVGERGVRVEVEVGEGGALRDAREEDGRRARAAERQPRRIWVEEEGRDGEDRDARVGRRVEALAHRVLEDEAQEPVRHLARERLDELA